MNKKLIINVITLATTTLLLVLVMFSWYVTNKEVSARGIIASTDGDDYTLHLERGRLKYSLLTTEPSDSQADYNPSLNDGNHGWYWDWDESDAMTFSDIQPGDAFFFRIVLDSGDNHTFTVKFSQIVSSLLEDTITAYKNDSLVPYTRATEFNANKKYYTASFVQENVTVGNSIKPYAYYTYDNENKVYTLVTDTKFKANTTYYKAKFNLELVPDFNDTTKVYYEKGSAIQNPNAIGFSYGENQYNYLYPLNKDNKVEFFDGKTLYSYDDSNDTISLGDYLIEDVFKVHDIGVGFGQNKFGKDSFKVTDDLYKYTYTETTDTAMNPRKTYYFENSYYKDKNGSNMFTKYMESSFQTGIVNSYTNGNYIRNTNVKYYTKGTRGNAYYNNANLKDAAFEFDAVEGKNYYYFALEFNEAASMKTVDGVTSSNFYLYQKLSIKQLHVEKKQD